MAVPGWNVGELLHVAKAVYDYIQALRGASDEVKSFASKINTFCGALEELDKCLADPTTASAEDTKHLRDTLNGCWKCATECQKFIEQFKELNEPIRGKMNAGDKVTWVWKKDTAVKLRQEINSQIIDINLLLGIASLKNSTRQQSPNHRMSRQATLGDDISVPPMQNKARQMPLTPAVLLNLQKDITSDSLSGIDAGGGKWIPKASSESASTSPTMIQDTFTQAQRLSNSPTSLSAPTVRRQSLQDFPSPEVLLRRDSRMSTYTPVPDTTMDNLDGVKIYYNKSKPPLPIKKLEFMTDADGNPRYIIATPPYGYNARFHQRISRSSRSIPHTEHPKAYGNQKRFLVKFLEPHQFTSERWSPSSKTPSIRSMGSQDTPSTIGSVGSVSTSVSIGSPVLPAAGGKVKEETEYPMYEFQRIGEYWSFQENIIGKKMLLNAPVDYIAYQRQGESKPSKQSERQYLRLWKDGRGQTIMFHANNSGQYLEYDMELFRPVTGESPYEIILALKANGDPSPETSKRRWSIKSNRTNSISTLQGSRSPTISAESSIKGAVPKDLIEIEFLTINFTDLEDQKLFLEKADFNTKAQSPMIFPPGFEFPP